MGAERNTCVEVSLERGRRGETYLDQESASEQAQQRINDPFMEAFEGGFFKVHVKVWTRCFPFIVVCPHVVLELGLLVITRPHGWGRMDHVFYVWCI